jgi:hypothetical protein
MRPRIILACLPFILLLLAPSRADACTCAGPVQPCEAYGQASAVFVGTVTGVKQRERKAAAGGEYEFASLTVKFSVEQAFAGVSGSEVEVSTGRGGGDCGYHFRRGVSYLVYASRAPNNERLFTSICSRTAPALAAAEDLAYLRGLSKLPPGVQISGRVERYGEAPAKGGARRVEGMAGVAVVVEGEGEPRELRTDAEGNYSVTGLRPGGYKVSVRLPGDLFSHHPERRVQINDRGCATAVFYVTDKARAGT